MGTANRLHYRSFLTDISARKRVEEALLESERRFRSLFESMTEDVALHELVYEDGRAGIDCRRTLDVNPAFETQTGLVAREAKGRLAGELYGTGEAPYLAEYAEVAESGRPYYLETYFASMERPLRITAITPGPGRFATVFEDVTERKSADAERPAPARGVSGAGRGARRAGRGAAGSKRRAHQTRARSCAPRPLGSPNRLVLPRR